MFLSYELIFILPYPGLLLWPFDVPRFAIVPPPRLNFGRRMVLSIGFRPEVGPQRLVTKHSCAIILVVR